MITHYLPIWTKMQGNQGLAVCGRFVDYATDSDQPTCEDCRRLMAEDGKRRIEFSPVIDRPQSNQMIIKTCDKCGQEILPDTPEHYGQFIAHKLTNHFCLTCVGAIRDWMAETKEPAEHKCYRCGKMTTLGTAWCQLCLDNAAEERRLHPPRPRSPYAKKPFKPMRPISR